MSSFQCGELSKKEFRTYEQEKVDRELEVGTSIEFDQ